jgi:hypothetical protein
MSIKILHIPSIGKVTFTPNTRSRSIRLRVKPDQSVHVTFPRYVTLQEAIRFAEQHTDWVSRQKSKIENRVPRLSEDNPIKTRSFTILFQKHSGKFTVRQAKNQITLFYPEEQGLNVPASLEKVRRVVAAVYRIEAREYLPGRLAQLAAKCGFRYNGLTIRNNKSNWGSCSSRNTISLNLHLMKLPDHLIDFILLHELVHTRVKNHGPEFWKMLDAVTGGQAKQLTREVKKYSPEKL